MQKKPGEDVSAVVSLSTVVQPPQRNSTEGIDEDASAVVALSTRVQLPQRNTTNWSVSPSGFSLLAGRVALLNRATLQGITL